MSTQLLTLPVDITWRRLAYSRDMMDTEGSDLMLPRRWRSSLAVHYYPVPEEQTAQDYPDSRIIYLRMTASISGWNPDEELRGALDLDAVGDQLDDLQHSTWEAISAEGWASQYWGCVGAIAQIAVYPRPSKDVDPDDYPQIVDVEPKKREVLETASSTGEVLSGSSNKLVVAKGNTKMESSEQSHVVSASAKAGFGGIGGSASYEFSTKRNEGTTTTDNTTTDASLEKRESQSFSSTFEQLYQVLNAYHVATNRVVFALFPRPHIVSPTNSTDVNLVMGQRKLEGIQEFLVIVEVPRSLPGICVQASLDTGHEVEQPLGVVYIEPVPIPEDTTMPEDYDEPEAEEEDDPLPPPDGETVSVQLVVTRRVVRNCGEFTDAGGLRLVGGEVAPPRGGGGPMVVNEGAVPIGPPERVLARGTGENPTRGQERIADQRNRAQRRVARRMLSGFTAGSYTPREFSQSSTMRVLTARTLRRSTAPLSRLVDNGLLSDDELVAIGRPNTVGSVFDNSRFIPAGFDFKLVREIRRRIVAHVLKPTDRNGDGGGGGGGG
jgi:hypothetical protein